MVATPDVKLFNIMVHVLNETNRHAGHADILREQLDGAVGTDAGGTDLHGPDTTFWENHCAEIERAAQAAARTTSRPGMIRGSAMRARLHWVLVLVGLVLVLGACSSGSGEQTTRSTR